MEKRTKRDVNTKDKKYDFEMKKRQEKDKK